MQALILVGGEGTRLRPLTLDTPKPMLPVVERPIIARVVEWLGRYGIERAVLSLGYRPDAFLAAFPTGEIAGVELAYAVEPEPLDTGGAIRFAAEEAGIADEAIIVVNGDVLTDLDLDDLRAFHRGHGAEATIALTPVEDPSAYGVVPTTSEGRVLAFIEKPPRNEAPTNQINAGTYLLEPAVLAAIEPSRRVSIEREVFPALVEKGVVYARGSDTYWLDTGTPDRYLQAQFDVLEGRRPAVVLPESSTLAEGIRCAPGAVVEGSLEGHVFVGRNARVALGSIVADAVVGERARVEEGAEVRRSLLLPGAHVGAGARVVGSILGTEARVGAGAVVENGSVLGLRAEVEAGEHLDSARRPV